MSNEPESLFLGVSAGRERVGLATSTGGLHLLEVGPGLEPELWAALATEPLDLEAEGPLLAVVAVPSGTTGAETEALVRAGRSAGWDAVLVVSEVLAAGRARPAASRERRAIVRLDRGVSSVGFVADGRLEGQDRVRAIDGREARELAVALRCLLKELRPGESPRTAVVTGEREELERLGQRALERELEGLGLRRIEFDLDPYRIARGALELGRDTARVRWRHLLRAQR